MEKIDKLKKLFNYYNLDGYIVPKNDEFFGEYIPENKDKLKFISNFYFLRLRQIHRNQKNCL